MDYCKKVYEAINEFVFKYQDNPFNFLYEADIRSILFSILFQKLETESIMLQGGYFHDMYGGGDSIQTIPVKCEYPTPKGHTSETGTFDIAVIDPNNLTHYDPEQAKLQSWKSDPFWNQNLRIAIEIKYWQLGNDPYRKATDIAKDIKKLLKYRLYSPNRQFLGIALIFLQSESIDAKPLLMGEALNDKYVQPTEGIYKYVITPLHSWRFSA